MFLYLMSGDVVKLPITLIENQSCNDKFMEIIQPNETDTGVLYKGVQVWAHYCKKGNGEWVR